MTRSVAQENERPAACTQYDKIAIPPADLPTPHDRQTLASCNSEDLYFGFDHPSDLVEARKCAYLERESGGGLIFGGSGLLTMIYANGKGAARNFDLALKFACEVNDPLQNTNGRVERLLKLREAHWTGDSFSLCDVEGPSFWVGVCNQLAEEFAQVARARKLDRIVERWTPTEKAAFAELQKAADDFSEASSRNEVDLTGTGRASFVVLWGGWLRDGFVAALERSEQGQFPSFSAAEFKKADDELNAVYSDIQSAGPGAEGMGDVTPEGVKTAQRAWLKYREAWVKFGLVKYPSVRPESWRTWLTYDRILMLHWLPGPQTPAWTAFQEYVPWRYQYDMGNYREAIRLKPDWAEPHSALGLELAAKGDLDGAIKEYREAVRLDPNNPDGHRDLGFELGKKNDWDGAVKEYREVVRLKPNDTMAHYNLASAFERKEDWDGAIREYREELRLKPDDLVAHFSLGTALRRKGDWDGAIKEYREATRLDPKEPNAHYWVGYALENKGDWDGATKEYGEALRLKPDDADTHFRAGYALLKKGDWDGAIRENREAIRLAPNNADAHNNLGVAFESKKDWDDAIREYGEAVRLKPHDAQGHYSLSFALRNQGDWDGAVRECREAIRLKPDEPDWHGALGWALEQKKDLDGAIQEYGEAVRLNPSWAEARSNLCYGLYLKGDVDAAIAECREAIRLKPDYAQARVNLAVALDKKGDWDGAIREYREAHRLEPSPGGLHYYVGQVLEHKGDKQAALNEYRQATEAEPKNSEYRAAYERLLGKSKN